MTQGIAAAAKIAAPPGVEIVASEPEFGPASIEGYLRRRIRRARHAGADRGGGARGVSTRMSSPVSTIPDSMPARSAARAPVVGIGEAAYHVASMMGVRFSVVTTLSRSIPVIEDNSTRYGLDRRCARVRAAEMPVLSLETDRGRGRAQDRRGDRTSVERGRRGLHRARLRRHGRSGGTVFWADSRCLWWKALRPASCSQLHWRGSD